MRLNVRRGMEHADVIFAGIIAVLSVGLGMPSATSHFRFALACYVLCSVSPLSLTCTTAFPLARQTSLLLLLTAPENKKDVLYSLLREVRNVRHGHATCAY